MFEYYETKTNKEISSKQQIKKNSILELFNKSKNTEINKDLTKSNDVKQNKNTKQKNKYSKLTKLDIFEQYLLKIDNNYIKKQNSNKININLCK